jgi:hypothetical protein
VAKIGKTPVKKKADRSSLRRTLSVRVFTLKTQAYNYISFTEL